MLHAFNTFTGLTLVMRHKDKCQRGRNISPRGREGGVGWMGVSLAPDSVKIKAAPSPEPIPPIAPVSNCKVVIGSCEL